MTITGHGDNDPAMRADTSEIVPIEGLIPLFKEGIAEIKAVEAVFDELKVAHGEIEESTFDVERADIFVKAATYQASRPEGEPGKKTIEEVLRQITLEDRATATVGYASMLIGARDLLIARKAAEWSRRPEVQAFVGADVSITPAVVKGDGQDSAPSVNIWEGAWEIKRSVEINGRISAILPINSGEIQLQGGSITFSRNGMGRFDNYNEVAGYDEATVRDVFELDDSSSATPLIVMQANHATSSTTDLTLG